MGSQRFSLMIMREAFWLMAHLSLPLSDSSHLQIAFFSPRPILYSAIRMGVFGFLGTHAHGSKSIAPVIKREEHISNNLLLWEEMTVCAKCLPSKHICLFCVWETDSPVKSYQSLFRTRIFDIFVLVVLQADRFVFQQMLFPLSCK